MRVQKNNLAPFSKPHSPPSDRCFNGLPFYLPIFLVLIHWWLLYIYVYIYTYIHFVIFLLKYTWFGLPSGLPDLGSVVKNPPANAGNVGDAGSTSGLRKSPGGGNGNPLQYSCLENPVNLKTPCLGSVTKMLQTKEIGTPKVNLKIEDPDYV